MRQFTEEEQKILDSIPNCSVPDCHYKSCSDTGKCVPHSLGKIPHEFNSDGMIITPYQTLEQALASHNFIITDHNPNSCFCFNRGEINGK